MKKILVITNTNDSTVDHLMLKYKGVVEFYRYNIDEFQNYKIIINTTGWSLSNSFWTLTDRVINSIYYRKPRMPDLTCYDDSYHFMIHKDILNIVNGLADSFQGTVLTAPSILRKTENKIYQMMTAQNFGMKTPISFLGNDNDSVIEFLNKKSIIKPISIGKTCHKNNIELYHTSLFTGCDEDISLSPIYLQEYVEKLYEVRLTIIDDCFYPIRIDCSDKIDWRKDYQNHKYSIIHCPKSVKNNCLKLMTEYGLSFGAFDFIVTPKNEWIFLEVNPNGQWLWLEKALNIDISSNILNHLLR